MIRFISCPCLRKIPWAATSARMPLSVNKRPAKPIVIRAIRLRQRVQEIGVDARPGNQKRSASPLSKCFKS